MIILFTAIITAAVIIVVVFFSSMRGNKLCFNPNETNRSTLYLLF